MKQTRRILALILSAALLLGVLPGNVLAAEMEDTQQEVTENSGGDMQPLAEQEETSEVANPPEVTEPIEVTNPPEVTEATEATEPTEETEPTVATEPTEATEPTVATEPTEETEPEEEEESDEFTQARFEEEYAAAGEYILTQSLALTSDLTLDHDIIVASGGELLVSESTTLTVSDELTIDGGTVDVLSGGRLVLESAGRIDVQRGLLRVREYANFVNNAGSDAISAAQDSGIIQGIDLTEAEPTEATEPTEEEYPAETETPTEQEVLEDEFQLEDEPVVLAATGGGIQGKIDLIRTVYPHGNFFTSDGEEHSYKGTCPADCTCSLSQITYKPNPSVLSGAEVCQRVGGPRWQCYAFATYVFYNIFGCDWTNCGIGADAEPQLGDVVQFNNHYGIFLYRGSDGVYVYDCNSGDYKYRCEVHYEQLQTGAILNVYHAPNYDEVNGTTSHTLDLNGFLDGQSAYDIYGYGSVDIYINGELHTAGAYDFYEELPIGTTYEIKNIQATAGHKFEKVYSGSLTGVISSRDVNVVLAFSTLPLCKVTYKNSSGDVSLTVSQGEYTVAGDYDKKDNSYFIGWAYTPDAEMFDVRPGEKINVTGDVTLYPVYISHENAISGKPVLIYDISDFPADGYTITETTKDISASATESGWGDWTGWSTTAVSETDTVQVESRTAYGWYYYQCPSCGAHMHGYGTCYTWAGGCGAAIPNDGGHPTYLPTSWDAAQDWYGTGKYYAIIDGARWFRWNDGGTQTQYRSRQQVTNTTTVTKTYPAYVILPETVETITVSYNANGGTGAPGAQVFSVVPDGWTPKQIPGQEVLETKTQYSSRKKTVQSSAEKNLAGWTLISSEISGYGEWSDWTATPIKADEDTEVRTKEVPATYKTVWHYSRDTANGYSTYAIGYYGNPEYITLDYQLTAKGTIDGHTHYGSYGTTLVNYWWNEESESVVDQNAYTAYSSRPIYHVYSYYKWSDWTEYSDTPVTASENVEVQTRTVYRYAAGVKIPSTVPVRSGYTFLGWATASTATSAAYQPGELFAPSADTTLYAVWKRITYTVSYNANGGTGAPASQTKTHGTALTLSGTKPSRANTSAGSYTVTLNANGGTVSTGKLTASRTTSYTFKNWNTVAGGTGTSYAAGASYTAEASATLYAQWNSSSTTASVTLPTPTRTGWTFQNWNTKSDGTGTTYNAGASYTPSGNVTLYAVWKQITYTVSYNANGGTGAPASQTKTHGTALTLSTTKPTRANTSAGGYTVTLNANGGTVSTGKLTASRTTSYTFKNWNTVAGGTGTSYSAGASYTAEASATLYAQWNSSSATASVTLPTPTRTGWTFQNWNTKSDGTGTTYSAGASYTPSGDVTLYAVWKQVTYTVSYDANGGTGAPASQTKIYGTALTLSGTKPTRANASAGSYVVTLNVNGGTVSTSKLTANRTVSYAFKNWNTVAGGAGTSYAAGASYTAEASATLYAQWNSSSTTASVTLPTPTRTGWTFQNWNTKSDGTGTTYNAGASYTPSGDVTLYAVWKQVTYTVSYDANGGTGAPASQTKTHGTALTLSSTKPTRANTSAGSYTVTLNANGGAASTNKLTAGRTVSYAFKNWNTVAGGTGTSYAAGASYTAEASATLYAQWNSSSTTASVTLPTLTRTGWTFQNWNTKSDGTGTTYNAGASYTPSGDVTLYAVWKQVTYTVSYDANGGTGASASQTKTHGTALTLSGTKPTRANTSAGSYTVTLNANGGTVSTDKLTAARTTSYTFKNWNTAADGTGTSYAAGASYTAEVSATLYAQWNSSSTTSSVTLPTPTRTGWTFQNWNTKSDGTGTAYNAGVSYTPVGDVMLYAVWETVGVNAHIYTSDANGRPGSTVTVAVNMENNPGIASIKLKVQYDENLELVSTTNQGVLHGVYTTSREITTNPYVLVWSNAENSEGNGTIALLTFKILDTAPDGKYPITIWCDDAGNEKLEDVAVRSTGSSVSVRKSIPGDVNGDGKVNVKDITLLAQYLAEWDVSIDSNAANVNADGKINVKDITLLAQYLAEWDVVLK